MHHAVSISHGAAQCSAVPAVQCEARTDAFLLVLKTSWDGMLTVVEKLHAERQLALKDFDLMPFFFEASEELLDLLVLLRLRSCRLCDRRVVVELVV